MENLRRVVSVLAALLLAACATKPRVETAAPEASADVLRHNVTAFLMDHAGRDLNVLALSGGGQNGAFGAGVLRGWREAGRPRFDVVTGISTGALQASHAFLDTREADASLERVYTQVRAHQIFCVRPVVGIPFEASVADFSPLARLLEDVVDDATIDAVAAASEGGRRLLLVGTTNLDSGRMAVWDMGELARRKAYGTYRSVLLAAASPPVAAEPVSIGGELHADGGVLGNAFVPNAETHLGDEALARYRALAASRNGGKAPLVTFHVIYNGLLASGPTHVKLGLVPIAERSLDLLTGAAGHGSLWYLYGLTQRRGHAFRYVRIPERLRPEAQDAFAFDPVKMRALYDAGVSAGRDPAAWATQPPPLAEDT